MSFLWGWRRNENTNDVSNKNAENYLDILLKAENASAAEKSSAEKFSFQNLKICSQYLYLLLIQNYVRFSAANSFDVKTFSRRFDEFSSF